MELLILLAILFGLDGRAKRRKTKTEVFFDILGWVFFGSILILGLVGCWYGISYLFHNVSIKFV